MSITPPPTKLTGFAFTDGYKDTVFSIWYQAGKPNHMILYNMIPEEPITGNRPAQSTLKHWVDNDFRPRGHELDAEVKEQIESKMIAEKVRMLERHANLGVEMQNMAIQYLEDHKQEITIPTATRLLVEGIRIERESRGIPEAIEAMAKNTDEELLRELEKIISKAPVDFEAND